MRYSIGLDIGIASTGFAVMELGEDDRPIRIIRIGSRVFDKPENPKDGASLALPRREARGMRRRIRRRSHRKQRIWRLIENEGILTNVQMKALYNGIISDVYELRCDALDRLITNEEFARILIHLSQRRGFKSNRSAQKTEDSNKLNKDDETGQLKGAVANNENEMKKAGLRTVGEMLYRREQKRNKSGTYLNTVSRDMVLDEVQKIFSAQRSFGNQFANESIEEKYVQILAGQRSFDDGPGGKSPYAGNLIERMLGNCTFEKEEKRAPKASYSFEHSNLLQKINNIRLIEGGFTFELTQEQRNKLCGYAHNTEKLTYKKIRKLLDIPITQLFNHVRYDKDKMQEENILAQEEKTKFEYLKGFHAMRLALKEIYPERISAITIPQRNEIARIFSLYKNEDKLRTALDATNLETLDKEALINNLGSFSKFGNLSVKALDKIIPHLEKGLTYDKACEAAGYDFKGHEGMHKSKTISLKHLAGETENTITSPVVRRALSQCAKVINAIIREMDDVSPVYINIELAREMAQTYKDRMKQEKSMLENQARNERAKNQIKEYGKFDPKGLDIVKLKLWEEQCGVCPYSLKSLAIERLFEVGYAEIDHIIPYSKCFNDGYSNKVLVFAAENQQKGDLLPLRYLTGKKRDDFIIWVNNQHLPQNKKRALLKEELTAEDEAGFIQRNLTDTQTISSFMYNYLTDFIEFSNFVTGRKKHVTAVNGAVTAQVRKRLGIAKIREDGDKHHAIDAAVIACITDGMIQDITTFSKYKETRYKNSATAIGPDEHFPRPYENFVRDLEGNLKGIFVSRAPSRKVTGAAHKETIKGADANGGLVKKVALTSLKLDNDGEIKDYYRPSDDRLLYEAIKTRLLQHGNDPKKAFAEPLYKPKSDDTEGPFVRGVKILEKSTLNVSVHDGKGRADNDSMVRVDVFYVDGKGGGYYLVPIYVADTLKDELPNRAIVAHKPYEQWEVMDDKDFIFSLYPNDLILAKHKKVLPLNLNKNNKVGTLPAKLEKQKEYLYYKGTNIATGNITTINHDNSYYFEGGAKTLLALEKWQVDVLGNISQIGRETRKGFSKLNTKIKSSW